MPEQQMRSRLRGSSRRRQAPIRVPAAGVVQHDHPLTRRWSGRRVRLRAPRPAYLSTDEANPILVDNALAGTLVRIREMYRVGPLICDIRALATPDVTPELWVVVPWYVLDVDGAS